MENEYFVETDGPDGLKHHVGPFKTRSEAEAWIAGRIAGTDAVESGAVSLSGNNVVVFPCRKSGPQDEGPTANGRLK